MDMQESGIRREIRRNPRNGDITIHLIGLKGPLIDSQIGTEGKEIDVFPKMPSDDGVQVRVISPPVPLLTLESDPVGAIDGTVYDREPSFGVDERLESNRINPRGLEMILGGFAHRTRELRRDERYQNNLRLFYPYIVYRLGNHMSDEKLIGRLLAARVIAPVIKEEVRSATEYSEFRGGGASSYARCMDCDIVREEIKKAHVKKSRNVVLTNHFVGIIPFSSSEVYAVNFIPRRHVSRFSGLTQEEVADLAVPLYIEMQKMIRAASGDVKFDAINVAIHSLPFYSVGYPITENGITELAYHTHVEIFLARLPSNRKEGYEVSGSRIYVSKVRPKDIGRELRIGVPLNHQP